MSVQARTWRRAPLRARLGYDPFSRILAGPPLKRRTNLIMTVVAAVTLAGFAYSGLTNRTAPAMAAITPASCTPEAIRAVSDALERSIRSAQCARAARPGAMPEKSS